MEKLSIEEIENKIRKWIKKDKTNFRELVIAVHNVLSHGEILEEQGYDFEEEDLEEIFDGFDLTINGLTRIICPQAKPVESLSNNSKE